MDIIDALAKYWFLILFVAGVIAAAVRTEMKVKELAGLSKSNSNRIKLLEDSADAFQKTVLVKLESIDVTQKFILETIKDIKNK